MVDRLLRIFAALLIGLGALWSLQGAGIVHIKPVMCVAHCTELQGASGQWLVTGLATIGAGGVLGYLARHRARKSRIASGSRTT
jgi:hypothetical protein